MFGRVWCIQILKETYPNNLPNMDSMHRSRQNPHSLNWDGCVLDDSMYNWFPDSVLRKPVSTNEDVSEGMNERVQLYAKPFIDKESLCKNKRFIFLDIVEDKFTVEVGFSLQTWVFVWTQHRKDLVLPGTVNGLGNNNNKVPYCYSSLTQTTRTSIYVVTNRICGKMCK